MKKIIRTYKKFLSKCSFNNIMGAVRALLYFSLRKQKLQLRSFETKEQWRKEKGEKTEERAILRKKGQ